MMAKRHLGNHATKTVRLVPARVILARKDAMTHQLQLELDAERLERELGPVPEPDPQLELLAPGEDQLQHKPAPGQLGLPDPRTLWYSSSRED